MVMHALEGIQHAEIITQSKKGSCTFSDTQLSLSSWQLRLKSIPAIIIYWLSAINP